MADTAPSAPPPPKPGGTVITPPRRGPGHRGQDIRDTVAEMAARAQEISMEAGSKMAAAMKDVITAAAGLSSFAIESARDLVQYMVRRGQMTQDEADKLIREVEEAQRGRGGARSAAATTARPAATTAAPIARTIPARTGPVAVPTAAKPARAKPSAARPARPARPARKPAAARASAKSHAKKPSRPAKKPARPVKRPAAAARKSTTKAKRR
jgi:hypothetical protein